MNLNRTHIWQWILALIVSLLLWLVSMKENLFEINNTLPLLPPSVSPDFIVLDDPGSDSVRITFTGKGYGVLRDQILQTPESVQIHVTMNDQNQDFPVTISRELSGSNIVYNGEEYSTLSVSAFRPASIEFTIDRNIIRNLPVALISSTDIPERYYWSVTSNSTVEVKGAESIVSKLDSCYAVQIDPGMDYVRATIVKPEGVVYISPSYISAELVPPVEVIIPLDR
jgi:hypothetical protein